MRIATPTLRCRVRSTYLPPSNIYLSCGRPPYNESYRSSRLNFGCYRVQYSRQFTRSTACLKSETGPRADNDPVKNIHDPPNPTAQSRWSLFGWTKSDYGTVGLYGRWNWLTKDEKRLSYEADVLATEPGYTRLVDWPKNYNDVNLWSCILDFRARQDGRDGISAVVKGLLKRRCLIDVRGRAQEQFWGKILDAALEDQELLHHVCTYAECMYEDHAVKWPNLYVTVISSFLEKRLVEKALAWDERLRPYFGLDFSSTLDLLKRFITISDREVQFFLRRLYLEGAHHGYYDDIIPHLYENGCFALANKWRHVLRSRNDGPTSEASRPYLRLRAAYYYRLLMTESEARAAGFDPLELNSMITVKKAARGGFRFCDVQMGVSRSRIEEEDNGLRYLVNRVHGETFGIEEKTYDDAIGSRWFASEWLSIEATIGSVSTLGFNSIGPLSLQSIGLRERSPGQITRRIEQLAASGISITESSYTRAMRSFAADGDQRLLDLLLQSDIHPDVFDDISTQREILEADARTGNWEQYELIVAVRLAVSRSVVAALADTLLGVCLREDRRNAALKMLDFCAMIGGGLHYSEHTVEVIARHFTKNVSLHTWRERPRAGFDLFQSTLLKKVLPGPFPLHVRATHRVLYRLGRNNLFDELAQVTRMLGERYHKIMTSDHHHMTYLHKYNLPTVLHGNSSSNFVPIPHDLNIRLPEHPVSLMFNKKFQISVVRWGFRLYRYHGQRVETPHAVELMEPKHFHFARGIRVLANLRDCGVVINQGAVAAQVMLRIAEQFWSGRLHELYGPLMRASGVVHAANRAKYVLNEVFNTCQEAWQTEAWQTMTPAGEDPPKPLLDRQTVMSTVQKWGKEWKKKRSDIFARFVSPRHAKIHYSRLRHPGRLRRRRDRVCVLGRLPERRYGPRSI